ncbi:MAG: lysyl oxidase family protein [Gemmatimonadaceae bacterium]
MADLIVDDDLGKQWVVRDENLAANFCSVIEGDVTPGVRRLVRFTVMTPNIGNADIALGDPNAHVAANDGLYEFASCHQHYHFRHYAMYQLIDPATGKVWRAAKRGFCMLDTDPAPASENEGTPPKEPQFRSCGAVGIPGNQGISAGWADTYRFFLGGQYFVLDGGDGQPVVPPGTYLIRITVNPPFKAKRGEPCPHTDPKGFCHQLAESNYDNNVGEAFITIPDHPGREGHGPLAGSEVLKTEPAEDENRPTNKS